jgi:NADH-quinone oxidoreductase subunit D
VLELDGERVARCTPHIGYLHSGFEKLGEHLDYNQYVTIVSRMNYLSPIANDICWHHAVEKLFGIDITPRCKVVRTIMAELGPDPGPPALPRRGGAGPRRVHRLPLRLQPAREDLRHLRLHRGAALPPGLDARRRRDAGPARRRDLQDDGQELHQRRPAAGAQGPRGLLKRNRIFIDRTVGIGRLSKENALAWSSTGPIARASGVRRDVRKDEPYLCYADNWDGQGAEAVKFSVPLAARGDVYAASRSASRR